MAFAFEVGAATWLPPCLFVFLFFSAAHIVLVYAIVLKSNGYVSAAVGIMAGIK